METIDIEKRNEAIKRAILWTRNVMLQNDEYRNQVGRCPLCKHNIADRTVSIYAELLVSLRKVYDWCVENNKFEFETKEIKHLLGKNEYARFGDLIRFGGIIYKPIGEDGKYRKGLFGINLKRAEEFFANKRTIPSQITINPMNNEIVKSDEKYLKDIPDLKTFLDEHGNWINKKL